jgi:hypothetical protein
MSLIGGCPPCSGIHAAAQAGELVCGQHAVPRDEADKLAVAVGEVPGHGQDRSLVPS